MEILEAENFFTANTIMIMGTDTDYWITLSSLLFKKCNVMLLLLLFLKSISLNIMIHFSSTECSPGNNLKLPVSFYLLSMALKLKHCCYGQNSKLGHTLSENKCICSWKYIQGCKRICMIKKSVVQTQYEKRILYLT